MVRFVGNNDVESILFGTAPIAVESLIIGTPLGSN